MEISHVLAEIWYMYCLCYKGIEQPVRLQEEAPWGRPWPVPEDVFPVLPELHWEGPEEHREGAGGEGSITIRTHRYRAKQISISVQTQQNKRQSNNLLSPKPLVQGKSTNHLGPYPWVLRQSNNHLGRNPWVKGNSSNNHGMGESIIWVFDHGKKNLVVD